LQISANTLKLLDRAAETFLQQPLALLLGQEQTTNLQEGLNSRDIQLINPLRLSIKTILAHLIRNLQKEENIFTGLKKNNQDLLDAVGAQGDCAVY
jgi:light-regulated signal transduction histidine kinase (bacteriophytochrome)